MNRRLNVLATRACLGAAAARPRDGLGCAQLEGDAGPTVVVTGPTIVATGSHLVTVGQTIAITVTTKDGEDASYTFTSADPTIATVDGAGVVTGVAPGETSVTITGDDSLATADYPIVRRREHATQIPYYNAWTMSAHADATALAFNNWNQDGQVPTTCARCHSSEGFVDYIGGDGSAAGVVDKPAPTKSVIRCVTCHNPAADALSSVTFPVGRDRRRAGRRGALHDLPPGALVGPRRRRRDRRGRPGHRRHRQRRRSTSRTSTSSRPPPRCSPGAPRAATSTPARSTTSASATSTATTPASAVTTRTRRGSSSTPAPAATPASPTSAARTRSG